MLNEIWMRWWADYAAASGALGVCEATVKAD